MPVVKMETDYSNLERLLRERLAVIADHALRERDAAAHLDKLRSASEALTAEHQRLRAVLPARLEHYLSRASFDKALAWITGQPGPEEEHAP